MTGCWGSKGAAAWALRGWTYSLAALVCLGASSDGALAQEAGTGAAASVEVEPAEVKLGEPVEVVIRIRGAATDARYQLPDKPDLGPFVELARDAQIEQLADKRIQVLRLTVASFEQLGELTMPGLQLKPQEAADGGAVTAPIDLPPVEIKVLSLLEGVAEPAPRDVAEPVEVLVPDHRALVVVGLVLVWMGLGFWVVRHRPSVETPSRLEQLPPPRQAHEIALEKLQAIMDDDLLRQGRIHPYFTRTSDAVREYMGNRYGFFALDLTTAELIAELRDRITPDLDMDALSRALTEADLVKFARLEPTDAMCSFAMDSAYGIVEATRFKDEPDEGRAA